MLDPLHFFVVGKLNWNRWMSSVQAVQVCDSYGNTGLTADWLISCRFRGLWDFRKVKHVFADTQANSSDMTRLPGFGSIKMASLAPASYLASSISFDASSDPRKVSRATKACLPPIATFSHNPAELISTRKIISCGDPTSQSVDDPNLRDSLGLLSCNFPDCDKSIEKVSFRCANQLKRHMLTHCIQKSVFCFECSLQFKNVENLRRHSLVHQGLRPYTCEVCHRTFSRTSGRSLCRKRHRFASRNHAPDQTGSFDGSLLSALELELALDRVRPRPYKCSICGDRKSYTDPGSLRKHKRRYHWTLDDLPSKYPQSFPDAAKSSESVDTRQSTSAAVLPNSPICDTPAPVQCSGDAALDLTESQYYPSSVLDDCAIDLSGESTSGLSSAPYPIDLSSSHHTYPQVTCDTHPSTSYETDERLVVQQTRSQQHSLNWDPEPGFSFTDLLTNMELDEVDTVFPDPVVLLHDLSPSYSPSNSNLLSPPLDLRLIHTSFSWLLSLSKYIIPSAIWKHSEFDLSVGGIQGVFCTSLSFCSKLFYSSWYPAELLYFWNLVVIVLLR